MILYAGPLQMLYERGFLRYISYRDSEILRMIYFALRDENWDTCEHVILREEKNISWETFVIAYESVNRQNGQDVLRWKCRIEGFPDSSVRFTIEGEVLKEIKKNRAGFCILHPLKHVTGQPVEIFHPDGSVQTGNFPNEVSPGNPFKNIQKMKWKFEEKSYELEFDGDIFETEDQRNWIDTSFKTFCTPADLPIPVTLRQGTKITQRVTFRPLEKLQPISGHETTTIRLEKTGGQTKLPVVGISLAQNTLLSAEAIDQIKRLEFDHLAITIHSSDSTWISEFSRQCEAAQALNLSLSITFELKSQRWHEPMEALSMLIQQNRLRVKNILFVTEDSPTTSEDLVKAIEQFKAIFPGIKLGAGTTGDFKDLNRNRFDAGELDFVSYSANPQVHAFDDRTLIENIDGLCETGRSASIIYPQQKIYIAPVTLQRTSIKKSDPRQKTELAALWAFGTLRATAEANVSSITLFETAGDGGIQSPDGFPYPVYDVLNRVLKFRNHEMVILTNNDPLLVDAILFTNENSTTLMLANYSDELQTVRYGRNEFQVSPMQVKEINLSST